MSFDIAVYRRMGDRSVRLTLSAQAGLTALIGPSGVGKTSVLNMVSGLLRPQEGRITLNDVVLFDSSAGIDLRPEQRGIGYVFQDARLFPHRRVLDNLRYGMAKTGQEPGAMGLDDVVSFLGIGDLLHRWPRSLSGGESRRVAIGRALLCAPRLLLMDEPLSSLDPARQEDIMQVIERLRDSVALPILYVSHDRAEVKRLANQIVPMEFSTQ